jgi:hypothetical protein
VALNPIRRTLVLRPDRVPAGWETDPTRPVLANLIGDYTYLTDGYYHSLDLEQAGEQVAPTAAECLDAYVVPIALSKAQRAGIAVPRSQLVTDRFLAPPLMAYPVNPFSSRGELLPDVATIELRRKGLTYTGKYAVLCQALPDDFRIDVVRIVMGTTRARVRGLRLAVWRHVPPPADEGARDRRQGRLPAVGHRAAAAAAAHGRRAAGRGGGGRMARLAVFTERYTIRSAIELTALTNFRLAAFELGHELDFVFKNELKYLAQYDAVLIRALTDPLNTSYVVARWAEMMGKRVLDTSESIRVCCDKVNMYRRLQRVERAAPGDPLPRRAQGDRGRRQRPVRGARHAAGAEGAQLLVLGLRRQGDHARAVRAGGQALPAPRRPHRRAAVPPSAFDWRVITLHGKVLAVVEYRFAADRWKVMQRGAEGEAAVTRAVPRDQAPRGSSTWRCGPARRSTTASTASTSRRSTASSS